MKKTILPILLFCATLSINAQEFLHINSHWHEEYIPVEWIDSISYGELTNQNMLPAIMAKDPKISIFNKALEITHLCDSMIDAYDYSYQKERGVIHQGFQSLRVYELTEKKRGYTAFVEPDSIYAKYGIYNIEDLKAYAARVYNEIYPEDASITDPTDRRNSLNRFISYHLLNVRATLYDLTVSKISNKYTQYDPIGLKYIPGVNISDWYETMMPHSLMKCTTPYDGYAVFINSCGKFDPFRSDTTNIRGAEITFGEGAANGYYYYIDDIIAYDKQTQTVVLDEQIIVNNTTLSPEFFNNGLRINFPYSVPDGVWGNAILLPHDALTNIKVNSEDTQIYYLFNGGWEDFQADEMIVTGNFDFSIKLPSVPAGTYELNLGCTAYDFRPLVVCYLNEEFCDTIDTRSVYSSNTKWRYWESDNELDDYEAIEQNDSLLFAGGYRKGLNYHYIRYDRTTTMRESYNCMRAIITTFTTDGKSDYYLRFRSVDSNPIKEFHLDYLELCPTHLLKEYK